MGALLSTAIRTQLERDQRQSVAGCEPALLPAICEHLALDSGKPSRQFPLARPRPKSTHQWTSRRGNGPAQECVRPLRVELTTLYGSLLAASSDVRDPMDSRVSFDDDVTHANTTNGECELGARTTPVTICRLESAARIETLLHARISDD